MDDAIASRFIGVKEIAGTRHSSYLIAGPLAVFLSGEASLLLQ
jgi:hypothetical protein